MYLKHWSPLVNSFEHALTPVTYVKRLLVLLLSLVDDAKTEVDFVGLVKIGGHGHDVGERLLGMVQRTIPIVKDTDAIPQARILNNRCKHLEVPSNIYKNLPLGLVDGPTRSGTRYRPAGDRPSSRSSDLREGLILDPNLVA